MKKRNSHTLFLCLLAAHSLGGSLLPIPLRLTEKIPQIMIHPLRKNIAFPVVLDL